LGWKGADKNVATVPQIYDLWQDPQERYDIFLTNFTESTWSLVGVNDATQKLMKTYVEYPPRPLQSEVYTGPITLSRYFQFKEVQENLKSEGVNLPLPSGN
ncbi:MAG: arylsulfatase, partial [Candidatus Dadabacteria bacterium]